MFESPLLAPHGAAIDPQRRAGQGPEEGAVVADQHEAGASRAKLVLEPGDGGDVEMVGRLVEQHQLRRLGKELGERGPAPLAARGGGRVAGRVEGQALGDHLDLVVLARIEFRGGIVAERREARHRGLLLHVADGGAGRQRARAAVGLHQPRHYLHQRRLAGAVPAHERHPVAGLNHEVEPVEDRIAAIGQGDVGELEKGCARHGRDVEGRSVGIKSKRRARHRLRRDSDRTPTGIRQPFPALAGHRAQQPLPRGRDRADLHAGEDMQRVHLLVDHRMVGNPSAHSQVSP